MEVRRSEWVEPWEKPIWWQVAAESLGVTHETLRRLAVKIGVPPHVCTVNRKRLYICYPSELLLYRALLYPDFTDVITVPDRVWTGRLAAGAAVGSGGVQRGGSGGDHEASSREASHAAQRARDPIFCLSRASGGHSDDARPSDSVGSGKGPDDALRGSSSTRETNSDGDSPVGPPGVDAT